MSNLQTYYHFKLDFQKKWTNIQEASGKSTAPNVAMIISCRAWNSPIEHPSRECKHDIKETEGNMFNPRFKENVHSIDKTYHLLRFGTKWNAIPLPGEKQSYLWSQLDSGASIFTRRLDVVAAIEPQYVPQKNKTLFFFIWCTLISFPSRGQTQADRLRVSTLIQTRIQRVRQADRHTIGFRVKALSPFQCLY